MSNYVYLFALCVVVMVVVLYAMPVLTLFSAIADKLTF